MGTDKLLTRIGGLLRQAESTDNEHEAEAFMAAAQRLATQSSIDLAVARAHTARREERVTPTQRVVQIGEVGKKGLRTYVTLFVAIAHANDVRCDIARSSGYVIAYGFGPDIDATEALYSSVLVQMVKASDSYIKSGRYRDELVRRDVVEGRGRFARRRVEWVPIAGVTARLNFQLAYANRIGQRLNEVREQAQAEVIAAARGAAVTGTEVATGTEIALRNKEVELKGFYEAESQARGVWRGAHATVGSSSAARRAGDRAGRSARLGTSPELAAPRGQLET